MKERRHEYRNFPGHLLRHEDAIRGAIVAVMVIALAVMSRGRSIAPSNISNIVYQSSIRGLAAIGEGFVILSGGLDISVGGLATLAATVGTGLLTQREVGSILGHPLPLGLAVLLMLLVGIGVGAFNGILVSRIGMPSLIVTLAVWRMAEGGARTLSGGYDILYLPQSFAFFGQGSIGGVPTPVIVFIATALVAYVVLQHSNFGRFIYAVGGNEISAQLSGIGTRNVRLTGYIVSGFLASLTAVMIASRTMFGSIRLGANLELDSITAVVVGGVSLFGGRGSLIGMILGVIILNLINNGMVVLALPPTFQQLIKGGIIFAAVAVDSMRGH